MKSQLVLGSLFAGLLFSHSSKAQGYIQDISGRPITERNVIDLGGSPYFNDQFLKGSITLEDKTIYTGLYLRYDQESDQLVYREANSSASMAPTGRVVEFKIELPEAAPVTFKSIIKNDPKIDGFYQVISSGKVSLLKRTKKSIVERVEYNSTTKSKTLKSQTSYFIQKADGSLVQVNRDKKSFVKALGGNEAALNDYVTKEDIDFKSDSGLKRVLDYYNTLI